MVHNNQMQIKIYKTCDQPPLVSTGNNYWQTLVLVVPYNNIEVSGKAGHRRTCIDSVGSYGNWLLRAVKFFLLYVFTVDELM